MKKPFSSLITQSLLVMPIASLMIHHQSSLASQPIDRQIDDIATSEMTVAAEGQQVCAKHPSIAKAFCTNLEQILKIQKGQPMIDLADASSELALMNITDAESDAAVAMFGCDCAISINRLRHVRNQF
jgi:hypothetical protein